MKTCFTILFVLLSLFQYCFLSIELSAQCTDNGNYWNDSWVSCQKTANPNPIRSNSHWILYEFTENQYIDSSYVWNANRTGESGMGANEVIIDYSLDGTTWIELGTYNFPQAPETDTYTGFQGPNFGSVFLNKILITVVSNHDGSSCASLSEMQFKIDPDACYGSFDECGICNGPGAATWYLDVDGDGLGDGNATLSNCSQPNGYVNNSHDNCDNGALGWTEIGPLLEINGCLGCHGGNAAGGLNLTTYSNFLMGGNICGPSISTGTNLVGAITTNGYDACGTPIAIPNMNDRVSGNLDATEIAMIQAWIDGGAPEFCDDYLHDGGMSSVNIKVNLEGPYKATIGKMNNTLATENLLPASQPYYVAPYNYMGTEALTTVTADMVDWVLVEMRSGKGPATKIESKAGILMTDGFIKSFDGTNDLSFNIPSNGSYYFIVRHRNHLDIMTASPIDSAPYMSYDFTTNYTQAYGTEQLKVLPDGTIAMFAGDVNSDFTIQTTDYDAWKANPAVLDVYNDADMNMDGTIQATDYDPWYLNKAKLGIPELGF